MTYMDVSYDVAHAIVVMSYMDTSSDVAHDIMVTSYMDVIWCSICYFGDFTHGYVWFWNQAQWGETKDY